MNFIFRMGGPLHQIKLDNFNEQQFLSPKINKEKYIEECSVKKSFVKELPFRKKG